MPTPHSEPLITVGVPTYNRASYLPETLTRIIEQDYRNLEILVCDDGSTDATPEVMQQIRDPRVRYLRMPRNLGIPHGLNQILGESRGEAIVMLHDHDVHQPALVRSMADQLWSDGVGFVNPGVAWMDADGTNYEVMPSLPSPRIDGRALATELLLGPSLSCPITACALVKRSAYEAVGFAYDPAFGFLSDVDLWLRLLLHFDLGQADAVELVCRRRDADHPYARAGWQLLALSREIHRTNISRLFDTTDPVRPEQVRQAERNLARKVQRTAARSLASAMRDGDRDGFFDGLRFLASSDDKDSTAAGAAARAALRYPRLSGSLAGIPWLVDPVARLAGRARTAKGSGA